MFFDTVLNGLAALPNIDLATLLFVTASVLPTQEDVTDTEFQNGL
jgi:hypothetical protein